MTNGGIAKIRIPNSELRKGERRGRAISRFLHSEFGILSFAIPWPGLAALPNLLQPIGVDK